MAREAGLPVTWLDRLDLPFETQGGGAAGRPVPARPDRAARRAVAPGRRARGDPGRGRAGAPGHRPRPGHRRDRRRLGDGADRRAGHEHADPRPGRLLRPRRAGPVLRPGLPYARAGRRRDVPLGRDSPAGRSATPPTRTAACCSSAATATPPGAAGPRRHASRTCGRGRRRTTRRPRRRTRGRPRTTCRTTRCRTPARCCRAPTRSWSPAATRSGA